MMRPRIPIRSLNRLTPVLLVTGFFLGLVFWKIDYVYEVALFSHLAHEIPTHPHAASTMEIEDRLFRLVTHQVSRNLYIKDEKSPLVFLLNGFALCDQQAKVLSRLLYFNHIPSRAVPLFFDTGASNHTIIEWFDGRRWVITDPFLHMGINIPAHEFCALETTRLAQSEGQERLIRRAHEYYAINQGLLQELKETYARPDHSVWNYFKGKPESRLIESLIAAP